MAKGSSTTSKTAIWILMGLLIISLAGFGATGIGGNIRTIGKVGDKDISVNQYAQTIQSDLRAISAQAGQNVPFATAEQLGLTQQALARVVTLRALDHEMAELGLSVGDTFVQQQILSNPAFVGVEGTFDRANYRFALEQSGLSEGEFEESLREDATRTLVQGAILSGNTMPDSYTETLLKFIGERRNATVARLTISDLDADIADPTPAQLQSYYDDNIDAYTLPETKEITYAWLAPDMVIGSVEVEDDVLRAAYEERSAEFNQPERRLVERLVFANDTEAEAANARLGSGEVTFEGLVQERGLALTDIDLGDLTQADLGDAGEAIFTAQTGDIVGPAPSDLGPALFRVNAVLAAQSTSFEEALPQLRDELAADRARRVIEAQVGDVDDLLAGGATLEELATETEMQVGTVSWSEDVSDGLAAYDAFRTAARAVTESDFPQVELLEDGGIFAIRLDETLPPRPQPFDEVQDRVAAGWETAQIRAALRAQADALVPQISADTDVTELGLAADTVTELTRTGFVESVPRAAVELLFEAATGETVVVEDGSTVVLARLDEVLPADMQDEDMIALRTRLQAQAESSLSQDLFDAYSADIQQRAGIYIDQNALNAVHSSFQ